MKQQAPEWLNKAKAVETFAVDIGFAVSRALYIGDDNDAAQLASDDPAIYLPLPPISYAPIPEGLRGTFARLEDVAKSPSELIHYFKSYLGSCQQAGKLPMLHSFWLRPMIFAGDNCVNYLPCHDAYRSFQSWAKTMLTSGEPQVFWDADQGWELEVWQTDDDFYFMCIDPDDPEDVPECHRFPKAAFRAEIERLLNACPPVFKQISAETGLDFLEIEKSVVRQQEIVLALTRAK